MISIFCLSDVVLDPVLKEVRAISEGVLSIEASYEEDIISRILSLQVSDVDKYDILFLHSDQVFHQKNEHWQKAFCNAVKNIEKVFSKKIILSNSFSQSYKAFPLKQSLGKGFDTVETYGALLKDLLNQSNLFVFDFLSIYLNIGADNLYNYNLGHLYQMPYTKPAIKLFASKLVEQVRFLSSEEKKAIILDCDNTLWKGIVGEDGIDGIACDKNADGIVYYNLQLFLKAKKEEGFLLCLCSKNNEEDVKEVFESKNLPLQWSDFIVKKVNWNDKVNNISSISKELNIGVDSFIFIDDNLFELNSIKELLSGISCLHMQASYTHFLSITDTFLFRRKQILKEDLEKTQQYELEKVRQEEEASYSNLDDFIKSLDIKLDIRVNDMNDLQRLAQMTGKTNQFNFNKHEYNVAELENFINTGRIYSLKVTDKYGDYGTVGLIMVEVEDKSAIVENYLMSCRALGKRIEYDFYNKVIEQLGEEGIELKEIRFNISAKNLPAQTFYNSIAHASNN